MEQVQAHLQEYAVAYILILLCLLPVLYVTRRYSVPLIQYALEIVIYWGLMHLAIWLVVVLTRWFREASTMQALETQREAAGWQTPLLEFWDRAQYTPEWLIWIELALALIIVYLVAKYRPLKIQRGRRWQFNEKKAKKAGTAYGAKAVGQGAARGRGGKR